MLTTRQLNKLAKRIYPSEMYSRIERKKLRLAIKDEMMSYLEEHPHTTQEDLQRYFIGDESLSLRQEISSSRLLKIVAVVGGCIIVFCVILYIIASTWESPTYYF
jgi:hypothetical protein